MVHETFRVVGSGGDGGSKSPGSLLERSDGYAEGQRVPHGGRLPCVKSVHRKGGDADAKFGGTRSEMVVNCGQESACGREHLSATGIIFIVRSVMWKVETIR